MNDEGFAVIDAMVALAILASVVAISLTAGRTAVRLAEAASETRQAEGELRYLLAAAPRALGAVDGRGAGFDWRVVTRTAAESREARIRICERSATVRSLASGRVYALATDEACSS